MTAQPLSSPAPAAADRRAILIAALEPLAKILALLGIALYVLGLLIFNTFLAKYGITDFAALKPQCLFTGAWGAAILLMAASPVVVFNALIAASKQAIWKRALLAGALALAFTYCATFVINVLFGTILAAPRFPVPHLSLLDAGIPGWRPLLFTVVSLGLFMSSLIHVMNTQAQITWYLKTALALIVPSLVGVFIIGHEICESVNPEVGGGRPQSAILYLAPEGQSLVHYMRTASKPIHDDDPDNAITTELIYTTTDRYVFRISYCRHTDGTASKPDTLHNAFIPVIADKKLIQAVFFTGQRLAEYGAPCPNVDDVIKSHAPKSPPPA